MKKYSLTSIIGTSLIYLTMGILLLVLPHEALVTTAAILLGIAIVFSNIPTLIMDIKNLQNEKKDLAGFIFTCCCVTLGILLIILRIPLLFFIVGGLIIVFSILSIYYSPDRQRQLKLQLPKLVIGALISIVAFSILFVPLMRVLGIIIIVFSLLYLSLGIYVFINDKEEKNQ